MMVDSGGSPRQGSLYFERSPPGFCRPHRNAGRKTAGTAVTRAVRQLAFHWLVAAPPDHAVSAEHIDHLERA